MKKFFIIHCFLIASFVFADDIFLHPLDDQTEMYFKEASEVLIEHAIVKGSFEQIKILSKQNKTLKSSGNFIIANGIGMVWQTLKPYPSTIAAGKDFMIQTSANGKKMKIDANNANEAFLKISEAISIIFSGDANEILRFFDVYFSGTRKKWELGLIPKDNSMRVIINQIIVKGDSVINYIKIVSKNGDANEYILSGHVFEKELTDNEKLLFE
ncbi:MAG: outer membrane lipoprotein carrier protein LolA [Spirochaetaceae bacterium]|jgi:outer membrane lipoprotein-sorting protein|nr:outer membrane lipoprotein carrier protein LolA [Spirochaetaceae bacterium]